MGRMECYKKDAYHVRKYSRPTPRLAHVIFYLFFFSIYFDLLVTLEFRRGFLARLRFLKLLRVFRALLEYMTCLVNKGKDLPAV